jgi:hypothetical protein
VQFERRLLHAQSLAHRFDRTKQNGPRRGRLLHPLSSRLR